MAVARSPVWFWRASTPTLSPPHRIHQQHTSPLQSPRLAAARPQPRSASSTPPIHSPTQTNSQTFRVYFSHNPTRTNALSQIQHRSGGTHVHTRARSMKLYFLFSVLFLVLTGSCRPINNPAPYIYIYTSGFPDNLSQQHFPITFPDLNIPQQHLLKQPIL